MKKVLLSLFLFLLSLLHAESLESKIQDLDVFQNESIRIIEGHFSSRYNSTFIVQIFKYNEIYQNYFAYENNVNSMITIPILRTSSGKLDSRIQTMLNNEFFNIGRLISNIKIADFNNDGIEEFLLYQTSGVGPYCKMFRFVNGVLDELLSFEPSWSFKYPFQFYKKGELRVFIRSDELIYQNGEPTLIPYLDYKWNEENMDFEMVEKGSIPAKYNATQRLFYPLIID